MLEMPLYPCIVFIDSKIYQNSSNEACMVLLCLKVIISSAEKGSDSDDSIPILCSSGCHNLLNFPTIGMGI